MPGRNIPLVTDQIYHVLNRGVASQPVFLTKTDYLRALETVFYYQNQNIPLRYSFFLRLSNEQRQEMLAQLKAKRKFLVEIIAFCLMPNHFHLLLKQVQENGISAFTGNFTNSYTRYFNTKQKRTGPLFQGKFKAVRVETSEQLLHLSRYIHLNPYSAYVVKNLKEIENYHYSSFSEYLYPEKSANCAKEIILHDFKDTSSYKRSLQVSETYKRSLQVSETYKRFVLDQADYQRRLQNFRLLALEE